jgi:hypothetical protein
LFNIYVDGESHFIRTEACVKSVRGKEASLDTLPPQLMKGDPRVSHSVYPTDNGNRIRVNRDASFFWDGTFLRFVGNHFHEFTVHRGLSISPPSLAMRTRCMTQGR